MAESMGSFGTKKIAQKAEEAAGQEPDYVPLTWFGETIRLREWFNPFPMSKFSKIIANDRLRVNIPATAAILEVLEAAILEEDWALFEALGQENDATIDLMEEVAEHLLVLWTRRPTQPAYVSSTGQQDQTEAASSTDSSESSEDSEKLASPETPTPEPELATTS